MNFKLGFEIPESPDKLNLKDPVLLIGSCFSDEIGNILSQNKFEVLSNPFGSIYNPHTIFKLLGEYSFTHSLIESHGVFYHWDTHSKISGLNPTEVEKEFNKKLNESRSFLKSAKWLIITFGTAVVYEFSEHGIVANCHKMPHHVFSKRLLTQQEIREDFDKLHSYLLSINPGIRVIFTISPVRHIRDGLVENNRSKAILFDAVHSMVDKYENVDYFPSFEIVIDELRDYRFFKEDMIHPTSQSINYVWNRFIETYFDWETQDFINKWQKIYQALNHASLHPGSTAHQDFLRKTIKKLEKLNDMIDLHSEIDLLENQIIQKP